MFFVMRPALIVHGGAGKIAEKALPAMIEGCRQAALEGWGILEAGGSALDAAEAAVVCLEDNPLFNAGTGSTLNALGQVEMDAAIMDGKTLRIGAVAAVQQIKNPIRLARRIMEDGRHVLFAGPGALRFAAEAGIPPYPDQALIVEEQRKKWQSKHGTVGCVALDRMAGVAAATSTGGIFDKLPGRVGDSPLPGCGTYADETGAVSCTGHGESIIRILMAKTAVDLLRGGLDPMQAALEAVRILENKTGSQAGLIVIDRDGRIGYARNTERMPVCLMTGSTQIMTDS
jgi:beta-aspartyl-peptidase (threonine type)